jgi:hypothetical protein
MSIPRKMQTFASVYGCEIVEKPALYDGVQTDYLFATCNGKEEAICRSYYGNHIDLNTLKDVLQRVSGRTLAQFWTNR